MARKMFFNRNNDDDRRNDKSKSSSADENYEIEDKQNEQYWNPDDDSLNAYNKYLQKQKEMKKDKLDEQIFDFENVDTRPFLVTNFKVKDRPYYERAVLRIGQLYSDEQFYFRDKAFGTIKGKTWELLEGYNALCHVKPWENGKKYEDLVTLLFELVREERERDAIINEKS